MNPESHIDVTPAVIAQLRDVLAGLFDSPDSARRVAADAGLRPDRLALQGSPQNYWHEIVEEARKAQLLGVLVRIASQQYPANAVLAEAASRFPSYGSVAPATTGSMPPHNLLRRTPSFIGRSLVLHAIHRRLVEEPPAELLSGQCTLYGLGGVGKTSIALEYAYRYMHAYPGGLWWVDASAAPDDAFARLAGTLRIIGSSGVRDVMARVPRDAPANDQASAVRLALQNQGRRTLLVLDNVETEGWSAWFPGGPVAVLALARDRTIAPTECTVRVDPLDDDETHELASRLANTPTLALADQEARSRVLVHTLGGLPLAVTVAVRAVTQMRMTWRGYEQLLTTHALRLLDDPRRSVDYPRGVFAALDVSLDRCAEHEIARRMLDAAALFAPEFVPLAWITEAIELEDELDRHDALEILEALALISVNPEGGALSFHRLVQWRVRDRITEWPKSVIQRAGTCVYRWLDDAIKRVAITEAEARRPHVESLLGILDNTEEHRAWIQVADKLSVYLRTAGQYQAAAELARAVLRRAEELESSNSEEIVEYLMELGATLRELDDSRGASESFERALGIASLVHPPDSKQLARVLSNVSLVRHDIGDVRGALEALDRAAVIWGNSSQRDRGYSSFLMNMGMTYRTLGYPAKAKPFLEQALQVREEPDELDRPRVAVALMNLALVLRDLGNAAEALPLLERALSIHEATHGSDHPVVSIQLSNLALVLLDLGDAHRAEPLLVRAIGIDEKVRGKDHRELAMRFNNLGLAFRSLGKHERALSFFERALSIHEHALGPEHPEVAIRLSNVALNLHDLGRPLEARPLLERALRIHENAFAEDHPNTALLVSNLGMVLSTLGEDEKARELYVRAINIRERLGQSHHPAVASPLSNLALIEKEFGFPERALPLLMRAIGLHEAAYGSDHLEGALLHDNLASVLLSLGRTEDACEALTRALTIRDKLFPPGDPHLLRLASKAAEFLPVEVPNAARPFLEKVRSIALQSLEQPSGCCIEDILMIVDAFYRAGELDEAERMVEQVFATQNELLQAGHPDSTYCFIHLAAFKYKRGDHSGAYKLLSRAYDEHVKVHGLKNESAISLESKLAVVLINNGDKAGALQFVRRASEKAIEVLGHEHPLLATLQELRVALPPGLNARQSRAGSVKHKQRRR
ncbi:MAG: tetratricopeptide repeat protein [Candidatus Hydrogenedentes bacterium]|nr:tetratricopeptide repeat protein [Candidatus Hydrogenedentota bacterium]